MVKYGWIYFVFLVLGCINRDNKNSEQVANPVEYSGDTLA